MKSAYLDNAATTLNKPVSVRRAVCRAIGQYSSPGRGGYPSAMAAAELCYACRLKAASLFHAEAPENVVFTMNATHGLNIAIKSGISCETPPSVLQYPKTVSGTEDAAACAREPAEGSVPHRRAP